MVDLESLGMYAFSMVVGMLLMWLMNRPAKPVASEDTSAKVPPKTARKRSAPRERYVASDEEAGSDDDEPLSSSVSTAAAMPNRKPKSKRVDVVDKTPSQLAALRRGAQQEEEDFRNTRIDLRDTIKLLADTGTLDFVQTQVH